MRAVDPSRSRHGIIHHSLFSRLCTGGSSIECPLSIKEAGSYTTKFVAG